MPAPYFPRPVFAMKISLKASLLFLTSGLVPLLAISLVGYDRLRAMALDKAHSQMRLEALRMVDAVDAWMEENRRMMVVLARNQRIVDAAQAAQPLGSQQVLADFNGSYPWHTAIFLSDITGQQIARSDSGGLVKMGHQPAAVRVLREGAPAADSAVIGTADGVPSILFVNAVKPAGGETLAGIVGARATVAEITRIVMPRPSERADAGRLAMLATPAGEVLVHSSFTADRKQSNLIKQEPEFVAASSAQGMIAFDGPLGRMLGHSARTASGWVLLYALPEDQVLAPTRRAAGLFAAICAAALVLFGGVAWLSGRAVAAPITHLARVANRVSKGELDNLELRGLEKRRDEIGDLAQAVERLVISFKAAVGMLKKRPSA